MAHQHLGYSDRATPANIISET